MKKINLVKIALAIVVVILGNLFWYQFITTLKGSHLLSSSAFEIIISFVYPIIAFSLYLSVLIYVGILMQSRLFLFFIIYISVVDYSFLLGGELLSILGTIIIAVSLYFFIHHFKEILVIDKGKTSISDQLSLSFSNISLIISVVLAVNFYNVYVNTLSSSDVLASNKIIAKSLSPIIKIYFQNFNITNQNERLSEYLTRRSQESKIPASKIRSQIIQDLGLQSVSGQDTMKTIIKQSLDNTIFKLVHEYRKEIPILISLGLGVITQTLISASSFVSHGFTLLLLRFFVAKKILVIRKKTVEAHVPVPAPLS